MTLVPTSFGIVGIIWTCFFSFAIASDEAACPLKGAISSLHKLIREHGDESRVSPRSSALAESGRKLFDTAFKYYVDAGEEDCMLIHNQLISVCEEAFEVFAFEDTIVNLEHFWDSWGLFKSWSVFLGGHMVITSTSLDLISLFSLKPDGLRESIFLTLRALVSFHISRDSVISFSKLYKNAIRERKDDQCLTEAICEKAQSLMRKVISDVEETYQRAKSVIAECPPRQMNKGVAEENQESLVDNFLLLSDLQTHVEDIVLNVAKFLKAIKGVAPEAETEYWRPLELDCLTLEALVAHETVSLSRARLDLFPARAPLNLEVVATVVDRLRRLKLLIGDMENPWDFCQEKEHIKSTQAFLESPTSDASQTPKLQLFIASLSKLDECFLPSQTSHEPEAQQVPLITGRDKYRLSELKRLSAIVEDRAKDILNALLTSRHRTLALRLFMQIVRPLSRYLVEVDRPISVTREYSKFRGTRGIPIPRLLSSGTILQSPPSGTEVPTPSTRSPHSMLKDKPYKASGSSTVSCGNCKGKK